MKRWNTNKPTGAIKVVRPMISHSVSEWRGPAARQTRQDYRVTAIRPLIVNSGK